jgi:hypothetical protein
MADERPEIAPDRFNFRKLDGRTVAELADEIVAEWCANGSPPAWRRFTVVNVEFPNEPYPPGVYAEGWSIAPWKHDPPGREAPFNYPLMAVEPQP